MYNLSLMAACELVNKDSEHILEFGVFTGGTLEILCQMFSGQFGHKQIHGFDSFFGLPEEWAGLVKGTFGTEGQLPEGVCSLLEGYPNLTVWQGWFADTLPLYKQVTKPIGLIHIDCDIYRSTKEVLFGLNDLILPNTILVFDEWCYEGNNTPETSHEQRAFFEWVHTFNRRCDLYEKLEPNRQVVKVTL